MPRLMFIAHYHEMGGGAEAVLDELLRTISREALDVEALVVVPARGSLADRMASYGVAVEVVSHPRWADFGSMNVKARLGRAVRTVCALRSAGQLVRQWHPDVILTNTMTIPTFAFAAKILKVPHIWMIHEFGRRDHNLSFALGYRRTVRLIGRLSARVTCCSEAVTNELAAAGVPRSTLLTIYPGVDSGITCESRLERKSRGLLKAVIVGRIASSKGQLLALQGVQRARELGADVSLDIVGPVHEPEYSAMLRTIAIGSANFAGPVADPTVHYCSADVALVCSADEAFGRVTVEAMKLGLPVIGTDSGGTCEIIKNGRNGYLVRRGDAGALAERLKDLWADEKLRAFLGKQAQSDALSRFSSTQFMNELLAVCDSVLRLVR